MTEISLTSSMRSNLASLRAISTQMNRTQTRLSTGLKVNSAVDNASSYYQARSLTHRAADLSMLLDSMGQGIQTINAANEGIEQGLKFLEQMKSVAEQAISGTGSSVSGGGSAKLPEIKFDANADALIAQGYKAITSSMSKDEINALLAQDNAKVVLTGDVALDEIAVTGSNVTINGAGHKMSSANGMVASMGTNVVFENIEINSAVMQQGGSVTIRNAVVAPPENGGEDIGIMAEGASVKLENTIVRLSSPIVAAGVVGGSTVELNNAGFELSGRKGAALYGVYGGENVTVKVNGMSVAASGGDETYAIGMMDTSCRIEGVVTGDNSISVAPLYDGRGNTEAIVKQLGADGLAAMAAHQFYAPGVSESDANFGAGQWYLPSIGELMDLYGYNTDQITGGYGTSGATGENKALVNAALAKLGGDAAQMSGYYWSSSEYDSNLSWGLSMGDGSHGSSNKTTSNNVRVFQHLENCFYPFNSSEAALGSEGGGLSAPKIGDVMYSDMSWGSADDYAAAKVAGKTAVGIINWISEDGNSAKIVNLKDLRFSSSGTAGNFNAANPYQGSSYSTKWAIDDRSTEDVAAISNYSPIKLLAAFNPTSNLIVTVENANKTGYVPGDGTGDGAGSGNTAALESADVFTRQFNNIVTEYDKLLNDASYRGINLLKGGRMNIVMNETRGHQFEVLGRDIRAAAIGLETAAWETVDDAEKALDSIKKAITSLREFSSEMGNNYQVIQTRQNFTDALINALETGADNLTLADMNEESANYLALQTRQQLSINSLSLAAASAKSILSLF